MTVYDPLTYRTLVSRPGEVPYKFWSVNKHVIDAAAAGICSLQSSDAAPGDATKLWLDLTMPENAAGSVKAYDGASWVALTPQLFYSHIAGGATGFVTDAEMAAYVSSLIGSTLQAYDADLTTWAGLSPSANAQSLVTAADYAAMRALLDLEAGTDFLTPSAIAAAYQPLDSDLTAIAALTTTSYGRAFLALADAAAGRTALALGTLATQSGTFSGTSSGTNTGDQTITLTGDVTGSGTGSFAATLATVNSNVGSFGLAASVAQFVVNAKGLITSAANVAISIASTAISDATSAGRAMLTAANAAAQTALLSAFVGDSGSGGTKGLVPAPLTGDATKFLRGDGSFQSIPGGGDALTSAPLSQFAATTSAQLRGVLSDESGTGAAYFQGGDIGTPSAGVLTNCILPADALSYSGLQVNGFQQISQESGDTAVGNGGYPCDQNVFLLSHSATATAKRVTTPFSSRLDIPRGIEIEVTAGASTSAGNYFALAESIEGERAQRGRLVFGGAAAKPLRIGRVVRSNVSGRGYVSVQNSAQNRSYLKAFDIVANTDTWVDISVPGDTSGTWSQDTSVGLRIQWTFSCGSTYHGTGNAWNASNVFAASDITNFAATTGNKIWLGPAVVMAGIQLPTFAEVMACQRHFDYESRTCQRYYWQSLQNSALKMYGYNIGTATPSQSFNNPVEMRTTPTVTFYGTWTTSNCSQPLTAGSDRLFWGLYVTVTTTGAFVVQDSATSGVRVNARM